MILEQLSPVPKPSTIKAHKRKKQRSEILTDTPNRKNLETAEANRALRQKRLEEKEEKRKNKDKHIIIKKSTIKKGT